MVDFADERGTVLDDSSASSVPSLKIGDVVERTGVSANTIRSWELRGQLSRPSRTETNRRLYSEADVAAIIQLRDRDNRRGLRVVERTESRSIPERVPSTPQMPRLPDSTAPDSLAAAYLGLDFVDADLAFDTLLAVGDLAPILDRLVAGLGPPGGLPAGPVRRFAAEHLRSRILRLLPIFRPDIDRRPIVVGAVGLADDLPALAIAILLARRGYPIVPLGRQLSLETLRRFHEASPAAAILLAVGTGTDLDEWPELPLGPVPVAVTTTGSAPSVPGYVTLPAVPTEAAREIERRLR